MALELREHQKQALDRICTGCILNGGTGSGKSITALAYYYQQEGGTLQPFSKMKKPRDLYIITTARKRDELEWEGELRHFLLTTDQEKSIYDHKVVVDSWNNIQKYADVKGAFFMFDEDRVTGKGAWVKAFKKIARSNDWIILSATPGDKWEDYMQVFIANGFYANQRDFIRQHIVYNPYIKKYPKVDRYINTGRLIRLRNKILIYMDFERHTVQHHEDVYCSYDISLFKDTIRNRWDPYRNEPIQNASGLCYVIRKIVNSDDSRQRALLEIIERHPKAIIFYNFDYELDILRSIYYGEDVEIAEWNGHKHQPIPKGGKWVYFVQYTSGCEGWNCITTDTIIFYSQNYSYKVLTQACGRIDRLNTPFTDLYYYHIKSRSGIDLAISKALKEKKKFNEGRWVNKINSR